MARYDDDLWELVPEDPGSPPAHLAAFVRSLAPAASALDLGVGDGRLAGELRAQRLTGADTSAVALERARTRLAPEARLVHLQADEPLPFGDNEFDLVLCAETLEHVRDVQLALSEIRRVLRPGGRAAITTPAAGRLRTLVHGVEDPFSPHLHAFTKRTLREKLSAMGFEVERLDRRRGTLMAVASR